jgi:hypothetical protein
MLIAWELVVSACPVRGTGVLRRTGRARLSGSERIPRGAVAGASERTSLYSTPPVSGSLPHAASKHGFPGSAIRDLGVSKSIGLSAVAVDPKLTELASKQANAMAERGSLDHNVYASFCSRMASYNALSAAAKTFGDIAALIVHAPCSEDKRGCRLGSRPGQ